ncbi:MAG: 50S ribosomal protein L5 [Clostridia bacterium]|nr:50S ribosomal protein L5 [Clostridia bacterium]MBQ9792635.1 50S ribosomal protein L5 [Clostridia bacterium]
MATNKDTARLREFYKKTVAPALQKEYSYKNVMEIPKIDKVVVCMGLGAVKDNSKSFNLALDELTAITGQKAVPTLAKKSISNFKVRENQKIGAKVTLRGNTMYEFLDRLIAIALPRVRDFKGVNPKAFDGRGNYALGIKEQLIFPEISYEKVEQVRGMDVIIVTTAKTDKEAYSLLSLMGMPFAKR